MRKLIEIVKVIIKSLIFTLITITLIIIAVYVTINVGNLQLNDELFKIVIAAIGICLGMSGLSFRASSSSDEIKDKKAFYVQGKRLFFATMLFIIAISAKYVYNEISTIQIIPTNNLFIKIIIGIMQGIFLINFLVGLVWVGISFSSLYSLMTNGIELLNISIDKEKLNRFWRSSLGKHPNK